MSYLPSLDEVSKYSVLVTIGTSVGFFVKRFWTVEERRRREIIKQHVKQKHILSFKHCSEDNCATLQEVSNSIMATPEDNGLIIF